MRRGAERREKSRADRPAAAGRAGHRPADPGHPPPIRGHRHGGPSGRGGHRRRQYQYQRQLAGALHPQRLRGGLPDAPVPEPGAGGPGAYGPRVGPGRAALPRREPASHGGLPGGLARPAYLDADRPLYPIRRRGLFLPGEPVRPLFHRGQLFWHGPPGREGHPHAHARAPVLQCAERGAELSADLYRRARRPGRGHRHQPLHRALRRVDGPGLLPQGGAAHSPGGPLEAG